MQHTDQRGQLFVDRRIRAVFRQDKQKRLAAGKEAQRLTLRKKRAGQSVLASMVAV